MSDASDSPKPGGTLSALAGWSQSLPRPNYDTLVAYADGALPPSERTRVEAALSAHPDLYAVVNALRHPDPAPMAAADAAIAAALQPAGAGRAWSTREAPTPPRATARAPRRWLAAAAVAFALALIFIVLREPADDGPQLIASASFDFGDDLRAGSAAQVLPMLPGEPVLLRPSTLPPPRCRQLFEVQGREVRPRPGASSCATPERVTAEGGPQVRFLILVDAAGSDEAAGLAAALAAEALRDEPLAEADNKRRRARVLAALNSGGARGLVGAQVEISALYQARSR